MLTNNFDKNLLFLNLTIEDIKKLKKSKILLIGDMPTLKTNIANFVELKIGQIGVFSENTKAIEEFFQKGSFETVLHIYKTTNNNLTNIIEDYDIIIDCFKNFEDKFLLNTLAKKKQKTFVFSSISKEQGQVALIIPNKTACLECMFPKTTKIDAVEFNIDCISNAIAAIQSDLALKTLLNIKDSLDGCLLTYDVTTLQCNQIALTKNMDCPLCK